MQKKVNSGKLRQPALVPFINGLIFVTAILFGFGQLGRIELPTYRAAFYLYEVPLFATLPLFYLLYRLQPLRAGTSLMKGVWIFLMLLFLTFIINAYRYSLPANAAAVLYLIRLTGYLLFAVYLLFHAQVAKNSSIIKLPLIFLALAVTLGTIVQYFFYPDLRNLLYLGWDPHLYRAFGQFLEPVITASLLGMILIHYIFYQEGLISRRIALFLVPLLTILIFLTYARSAIVALVAVAAVYFSKKNLRLILFVVIIAFILLFLLPKKAGEGVNLLRTSTINSRISNWKEGLALIGSHPLTGIGYNRIAYEKKTVPGINHAASGFQSSYLIIWATMGFFGLVAFVNMLWRLSALSEASSYMILFLCLVSFFDNVLLHPFILFAYILSAASSVNPSHNED